VKDAADSKVALTPSDVATITTVNEARASLGLPALENDEGELTVAEYKAKHAAVVAQASAASDGSAAPSEDPQGAKQ
jgi:hypothetical protein